MTNELEIRQALSQLLYNVKDASLQQLLRVIIFQYADLDWQKVKELIELYIPVCK